VLLVLTTSVTDSPALTTASHPFASEPAESNPLIIVCLIALNDAPAAFQASLVTVRIIVSPPLTISASVAEVIVPDRASVGGEPDKTSSLLPKT
jgi:hypothetical protein